MADGDKVVASGKRARIPTNFFVNQSSAEREREAQKASARPGKRGRSKREHAAAGRKAGRGRQSVSANEPESDVHDSDRDELSDMKTRAAGDGPATAKTQPAGGSDDDDDDDDDLDVPFAARRSKPAESVKQRKKSAQKGGSKPISTENSTTNSQKGLQKKEISGARGGQGPKIAKGRRGAPSPTSDGKKARRGQPPGRGGNNSGRGGARAKKSAGIARMGRAKVAVSDAADSDGSGWATGEEDDSEVADSDIVDEICHKCKGGEKPEKMLLCDVCDRGWHIYCLNPPLRDIPQGDWSCPKCVAKCTKVQQESDPKGWLNQTAAECQEEACDSDECEGSYVDSAPDELDMELTKGGREVLGELSSCWELASVVHFLGVFGVDLALTDASQPLSLSALSGALCAANAAEDRILANLHIALLTGTNLTRSVPLDEHWWPAWLAKWAKRRNTSATEREGKGLAFFEGCGLREDDASVGGANYNDLSPRQRLELLHQLCCDRLEAKRSLVNTASDANARDIDDEDSKEHLDDPDFMAGDEEPMDVGSSGASGPVPAVWRPKPKVIDGRGRRYWYFAEARGLEACVFRSSKFKTPAGKLLPEVREKELSREEEKELWACCLGDETLGDSSCDEEDVLPEDKCQVCDSGHDTHNLMLCDMCDEAFHTYCLRPVLKRVPAGEWACPRCDVTSGTDCPDKHLSPIARGMNKIETTVSVFWESVKKGEMDGVVMERIVTRRPKKAISNHARTFDVHYTYKRTAKNVPKRIASGIFRSLAEVHRYLNSLWLLAEEHLERFDFSCCYGADGRITDFGKETLAKSSAAAAASRHSTDTMSASDAASLKARQQETEKKLRRWRLCGWPRYETAKVPGEGRWETLSVDCKTLDDLKRCIDMHVGHDPILGAKSLPPAPVPPHNCHEAEDDGTKMPVIDAVCEDEIKREEAGRPNGHDTEEFAGAADDTRAADAGAMEKTANSFPCAAYADTRAKSLTPALCCHEVDNKDGDVVKGNGIIADQALLVVSQLAQKVLEDVAAEKQRKRKAEELRRLAEAEAARKRDRIRRQLGDSSVSAKNIVEGRDGLGRRARKAINYAEAEREGDRTLRRYINYAEFGKGKNPYEEDSSEDDEPRTSRRRVSRRQESPAPKRETREERLTRRRGEGIAEEKSAGSGRPRRAAAMASAYGERRESSTDNSDEEWVSGGSEEEEEELGEAEGEEDGEEGEEEEVDKEDPLEGESDDAQGQPFKHRPQGSAFAYAQKNPARDRVEVEQASEDPRDLERLEDGVGSSRKRRRILDEEDDEESEEGGQTSGTQGKQQKRMLSDDEDDEGEDEPGGSEVNVSSNKSVIASLVKHRERMSWVGRTVSKYFPGYGRFSGTVSSYSDNSDNYEIVYSDGDKEHVDYATMKATVVEASDEDKEESAPANHCLADPATSARHESEPCDL